MDRFLNILEQKKLRFFAPKISIWDFFGLLQTDCLALSKDEKIENVQGLP